MKEAYYFPHFCGARNDRKIKRLRKELGVEGYGIFFMILETLREQTDFMYPVEDLDLLADEFGTSEQKLRAVVEAYDLFTFDDENQFFSPKLILYLQPYLNRKEQAKKAINSRWEKKKALENQDKQLTIEAPKEEKEEIPDEYDSNTDVSHENNSSNTNKSKVKEKKVKEKILNEIIEKEIYTTHFQLTLYQDEYDRLILECSKEKVDSMINTIKTYSKDYLKKYASFNLLIRNWMKNSFNQTGNSKNIQGNKPIFNV